MSSQVTNIAGFWKINDYPQHSECLDYQFEISRDDDNQNLYHLHTHIVNNLNCVLESNPTNNKWKSHSIMSTRMLGTLEMMHKEHMIKNLISDIQSMEIQDEQYLIIRTNNNEQIRLKRSQ